MDFHEYAEIFPLHGGAELDELVMSLADIGQQDPIITYQGKILDGRRLYLACQKAGIQPWYEEYDGQEPLSYVVSKNLHRRHLTDTERALVAARIAKLGRGGDRKSEKIKGSNEPLKTIDQAAEVLRVSRESVKRAKKVLAASPAVQQAVSAGKVSLAAGAAIAELPDEQQAEAVEAQPAKRPKSFKESLLEQALDVASSLEYELKHAQEHKIELRLIDQLLAILETMKAGKRPPVAQIVDEVFQTSADDYAPFTIKPDEFDAFRRIPA